MDCYVTYTFNEMPNFATTSKFALILQQRKIIAENIVSKNPKGVGVLVADVAGKVYQAI